MAVAEPTADAVIGAIRAYAVDVVPKPLDLQNLRRLAGDLLAEGTRRDSAQPKKCDQALVLAHGQSMLDVLKRVGLCARTDDTVLIRGETGTGKEIIARAIHINSSRNRGPFIAVNCGALSPSLIESELFGHRRGAFTGALMDHKGLFARCAGGTILLDEIGDAPLSLQATLLRVLQEREYTPVGAGTPETMRGRILAATHRPLEDFIATGKFREDLYYRLRVTEIVVPPLRMRMDVLPELAQAFALRASHEAGVEVPEVSFEALEKLRMHSWPGNVRELENCLRSAVQLSRGGVIRAADIQIGPVSVPAVRVDQTLAEVERAYAEQVLRYTNGHKSRTAGILHISRTRLDRILKRPC